MSEQPSKTDHDCDCPRSPQTDALEKGVLGLRWLMLPLIVGLAGVAMVCLNVQFVIELIALVQQTFTSSPHKTLTILTLMENFMVGALLLIVGVGGYHVYVRPINSPWLPGWLKNITPTHLEVATACNLAGVSSMILLQDLYIPPGWTVLGQHLLLHVTFLGTAWMLTKLRH